MKAVVIRNENNMRLQRAKENDVWRNPYNQLTARQRKRLANERPEFFKWVHKNAHTNNEEGC